MSSQNSPDAVCLDVAIDHRIRRLFKPVQTSWNGESGAHIPILGAQGRALGRPSSEISVTQTLAGPAKKGGIAVVLQQPRDSHPFEKGIDKVIGDCETLYSLWELFKTVSCGSLDIRTNVSVVDLLPYVSLEAGKVNKTLLRESFRTSAHAICGKEPDVVLCAGKIWLPRAGKTDDRKGEAWKLESLGVGKRFEDRYRTVRLRDENRDWVQIRRVNGFHLSHAVNYHSHLSCLRQLQFLIVAETCGVFRGDWAEESWMAGLRATCSRLTADLGNATADGNVRTKPKYLPDYQKLYSANLDDIHLLMEFIASSSSDAMYDALLDSRLSEKCNDATLLLRKMAQLETAGWHAKVDTLNKGCLQRAASNTLRFTIQSGRPTGVAASPRLEAILRDVVDAIRSCVTSSGPRGALVHSLDLDRASSAFLKMAKGLEILMGDLLEYEMRRNDGVPRDDPLSELMGNLVVSPS